MQRVGESKVGAKQFSTALPSKIASPRCIIQKSVAASIPRFLFFQNAVAVYAPSPFLFPSI
jgi:hypothetical protein